MLQSSSLSSMKLSLRREFIVFFYLSIMYLIVRVGSRQHGEAKKPIRWVKKYTVGVNNKVSKFWLSDDVRALGLTFL
jgi:hypothetical protein